MKRTVCSLLSLVLAVATMCSAFLFSLPAAGQSDSAFGQLKAQAKPVGIVGTWDDCESANLRFVVAIQDLHWDEVGFLLLLDESRSLTLDVAKQENLIKIGIDTVYRSIIADGETVTAAKLGGNYLAAMEIKEIPLTRDLIAWKTLIHICAYVKAGDKVYYTETKTYSIYDDFVPDDLKTTEKGN